MIVHLVGFIFFLVCFFGNQVEGNKCGELYLTVEAKSRKVAANWDYFNCQVSPNIIQVFTLDSQGNKHNVEEHVLNGNLQGNFVSKIDFDRTFPGNWNEEDNNQIVGSHCYPYHIESLLNGEILATACLKIEPSWMKDFGSLKITEMMIPGTHDTGSYDGFGIGLIKRYAFAQEYNVYEQLVSGIRYLDIRVGIYEDLNPIAWINHGQVRCTDLEKELRRLATFLRKSPTEVVILHFHKFEMPLEFTFEHHKIVLDLLQDIFGDLILDETTQLPTIAEQVASNKRLIISYNNAIVNNYNWLWHPIPHKWGNKQNVDDLHKFLSKEVYNHDHPKTPFDVLMAVLTPDQKYIFSHLRGSLRDMSDLVNPHISTWVRRQNWTPEIIIIATDFFMGNDLINISIEANKGRL